MPEMCILAHQMGFSIFGSSQTQVTHVVSNGPLVKRTSKQTIERTLNRFPTAVHVSK